MFSILDFFFQKCYETSICTVHVMGRKARGKLQVKTEMVGMIINGGFFYNSLDLCVSAKSMSIFSDQICCSRSSICCVLKLNL